MEENKHIVQKKFIASTEALNANGYRVLTSGIQLARFLKNPVCLYNHEALCGKWLDVFVDGQSLILSNIQFSRSPLGNRTKQDVEDGLLNALSIGIQVLETSNDPSVMLPGQVYPTVVRCELFEVSIVDIPANADAVGLKLYAENDNGNIVQLKASELNEVFSNINDDMNNEPNNLDLLIAKVENLEKTREEDKETIEKLQAELDELKKSRLSVEDVISKLENKSAENTLLDKLSRYPNRTFVEWWKEDSEFVKALKENYPKEFNELKNRK